MSLLWRSEGSPQTDGRSFIFTISAFWGLLYGGLWVPQNYRRCRHYRHWPLLVLLWTAYVCPEPSRTTRETLEGCWEQQNHIISIKQTFRILAWRILTWEEAGWGLHITWSFYSRNWTAILHFDRLDHYSILINTIKYTLTIVSTADKVHKSICRDKGENKA